MVSYHPIITPFSSYTYITPPRSPLPAAAACCRVASVVSDSVRPHRRQPTRLPCPWDSPCKNTGVDCHFLLQCMKVKRESEVAQLCLTLVTPWTAAYQAPLSMGFSSKSTGVGCHCLLCLSPLVTTSVFSVVRTNSPSFLFYSLVCCIFSFIFYISDIVQYLSFSV